MNSSNKETVSCKVGGMTCINCQLKIEKSILKINGVLKADVSWEKSFARVEFDSEKVSRERIAEEIKNEIEKLGYKVINPGERSAEFFSAVLYTGIIAALFIVLQKTGVMNLLVPSSIASSNMSYALLFVTGLLTSVHCVAMCGGINLSQSLKNRTDRIDRIDRTGKDIAFADFIPAVLYNLGRVISYTLTGLFLGMAGFLLGGGTLFAGIMPGSAAAGDVAIPLSVQGILKILAGIFMLLMGISILGIFPSLRSITPHLPLFLSKKISAVRTKNRMPLVVGLLNGFMPCGPLQAMWVVSLASASPVSGSLSMLSFSLGTVPLMLGLGSVVSVLGKKYTRFIMKAGAVLVIVMALSMLSQGFALGGWNSEAKTLSKSIESVQTGEKTQLQSPEPAIVIKDGKQIVKSTLNPYRYPAITVKKGVPVHWEINASQNALNGCNYKMVFRDFGFMYEMGYGTNVIEFTPEQAGTFQYTCWMGMVRGVVKVIE